jgi:hypothetical protein
MQDVESRCIQIALHRPFNTQPDDESVGVEFEQDLSVPIGFQGTIDRLLELVEGIQCSTAADSKPSATRSASFW